jgi:hypothetical protein
MMSHECGVLAELLPGAPGVWSPALHLPRYFVPAPSLPT